MGNHEMLKYKKQKTAMFSGKREDSMTDETFMKNLKVNDDTNNRIVKGRTTLSPNRFKSSNDKMLMLRRKSSSVQDNLDWLQKKSRRSLRHYCPSPCTTRFQNRDNHVLLEIVLFIFSYQFWFVITLFMEGMYIYFKCIYFVDFGIPHETITNDNNESPEIFKQHEDELI